MLRLLAVLVGAIAMAGTMPSALAQEASPIPGVTDCTATPRPVDDVVALWFGPDGTALATPVAATPVASAADLPQGTPADAATAAAVTATFQEVVICSVAGQFARAFGMMTDQAVAMTGPVPGDPATDTPAEMTELLTGQLTATPAAKPDPDLVPAVSAAQDARVLPDGRVGAIFTIAGSPIFALFVEDGGHWLLDETIRITD